MTIEELFHSLLYNDSKTIRKQQEIWIQNNLYSVSITRVKKAESMSKIGDHVVYFSSDHHIFSSQLAHLEETIAQAELDKFHDHEYICFPRGRYYRVNSEIVETKE